MLRRLLVPLVLVLAATPGAGPADAAAAFEQVTIGHSVKGRPITAWHLGEPGQPTVVLIAAMHGDETAPRLILRALRDGPPIRGVDLWVVPTCNPDGVARHSRRNAHGVDLNRNYPYRWKRLGGGYDSGPRPASEPETRAMMGFLDQVDPARVISFHQPLFGIDLDTKDPAFSHALAKALKLPTKTVGCGRAGCHGTMTMWFNHIHAGAAVTVEYGPRPARHRLRQGAPTRLLSLLGGVR